MIGYLKDGNVKRSVDIRISGPITAVENSFCSVRLVPLIDGEKKIFGIDDEQAVALAKRFVFDLLDGAVVVDQHDAPISLSVLLDAKSERPQE